MLFGAGTATPAAATKKLRVGMVGLGGRGTGTLGTIEGSALLAQKMEMVALADVNPETLEPHKSKGYALFGTASELIQVNIPSRFNCRVDLTGSLHSLPSLRLTIPGLLRAEWPHRHAVDRYPTLLPHKYRYRGVCSWIARPCLLYTSPSPRDLSTSRMPSSA